MNKVPASTSGHAAAENEIVASKRPVSRSRRRFSLVLPFVSVVPPVQAGVELAQDHRTAIRDGWILKRSDD